MLTLDLIDYCVALLSPTSNVPLILLATSPVVFTFLLRPFSNSLETLFFATALVLISRMRYHASIYKLVMLGMILAIGVWTRVTFLVFMAPLFASLALLVLGRQSHETSYFV